MEGFGSQLEETAAWMEAELDAFVNADCLSGPGAAPERLVLAMRHAVLEGGKRLRPLLVVQAAGVFGLERAQTRPACLAVELIHCYSLVHDDLPAMDDDDVRRGRPTVHRAYDEAAAILAGDGLLTHAFGVLADPRSGLAPDVAARLAAELAAGAGAGGMAGGQMRDLEGERSGFTQGEIARMQAMKTGALIRAAVRMGAILGGADGDRLGALTAYAEHAGRAYQLADDILDVTATSDQLGKATGKDAAAQKSTLVGRIGVEAARRHLGDTIHDAISALTMFGEAADPLRETARYFGTRER